MTRRFLELTRSLSLVVWGCALLLIACLIIRLLWHAAQLETGFQSLYSHWRDATLGWVEGSYEPISSRQPSEQAEYWLREIDKVSELHPNDAQLTMGAAIVLDSPAGGYLLRFVKRPITSPTVGIIPEWDKEGIKRAEDLFESRCKNRCLELAAMAARADPMNVERWRLYALLLQRCSPEVYEDTPRSADWLKILDECARHDPDNALYDYLAADFWWRAAAEVNFGGTITMDRLTIKDGAKFKRGVARFEQGQTKSCFAIGDAGYKAVADFLSHTKTPLTDHEPIVNSRSIQTRRVLLLREAWQWQGVRATERAFAGDPISALKLCRQNLHLIEQYEAAGAPAAYDQIAIVLKVGTTSQMQTFANAVNGAMSGSAKREVAAVREDAILQQQIVKCAAGKVATTTGSPATVTPAIGGPALGELLTVGIAPSLFVLLLVFGLLATGSSRHIADRGHAVVGPIGQIYTLAVSLATTVVLFGLAPAEIIAPDIQSWFFTVVLLMTPVFLVSWIGWRWLRKRAFQFSIRDMLIFTLIVSLFCSFLAVIRPDVSSLPFRMSVPARGWKGVDPAFYATAITTSYGQWRWIVLQWTLYSGPYLTLFSWGCLIAVLYQRKIAS